MATRIANRWLFRSLLLVLIYVALGYFSNVMSMNACQRETDAWLRDNLASYPQRPPDSGASSRPASFTWPWIVGVPYWWSVGPTGGEGGTRFYVCLFGQVVAVQNRIEIQS